MTTQCDICGREIYTEIDPLGEQSGPALCDSCKSTAKAHARVDRNYEDYRRACSNDEQLDRRVR